MVFEQFLESEKFKQHAFFIFFLGFVYVFIGFFIANYFFSSSVSVAMLFTCTLLLVPSVYVILNLEEKIESKEGVRHFYKNHKDIFKVFLFLFIGIFFAYFILGYYNDFSKTFDYQINFLNSRGDIISQTIDNFKNSEYSPSFDNFISLVSSNLTVMVIAFLLSVFYGAGALFLITLNASTFAAFIYIVIDKIGKLSALFIFLIHLIPELAGFTLAAIAGSVISRALVSEKLGSKGFKNVLKDSLVLLLISFALISLAAFLELFVSAKLVRVVI